MSWHSYIVSHDYGVVVGTLLCIGQRIVQLVFIDAFTNITLYQNRGNVTIVCSQVYGF